MAEENCGLCMFPDLRHSSNDFSTNDWVSIVTNGGIGWLSLLMLVRRKHSKAGIETRGQENKAQNFVTELSKAKRSRDQKNNEVHYYMALSHKDWELPNSRI